MNDAYSRIATMRDMFFHGQRLYGWDLDLEFRLLYSNSPNPEFFYNLFSVGFCLKTAKVHFQKNAFPVILSDKFGIAWLAAMQTQEEEPLSYHLLGPFYTVEVSDAYLQELCTKLQVSSNLLYNFLKQLRQIPTIPLTMAVRYGIMLYYCVSGNDCQLSNILLLSEETKENTDNLWASTNYHGTWEIEQKFFKQLQEGKMENLTESLTAFSGGRVGTLSTNDPLRQAKNELIALATLCCRAVIHGGVSPEGGYNLSDYYIQCIESCKNVSDVRNYGFEMVNAFLQRSILAKKHNSHSVPIAAALEYVETHIMEKISLDAMAKEVGYTSYYLSDKFRKEVGVSINHYIQAKKIEVAKNMLSLPKSNISAISERLSFSSPSYFSAIFRKETGMSPGEFLSCRNHDPDM